jgi:hypothetical protein
MNQRTREPLTEVTECGYLERGRSCHEPPTCVVRIGGKELGLCDRHSRPEFHPPDLHNRLPGNRLTRARRRTHG